MIIEVRPTPALRRHRRRIVGTVAGFGLAATSLLSVAELADAAEIGPQHVTLSDPPAVGR